MREGLQGGTALVGTVDAWLVWNLTGGAKGSAAEVEDQRPACLASFRTAPRQLVCGLHGPGAPLRTPGQGAVRAARTLAGPQ